MVLVFAVKHLYNILKVFIACPVLFSTFLKSGIDKLTEWSLIPACPSLMCFFNRGNAEGTNSLKILCLMFVYFLFYRFVSGLILWLGDNLWFDDLCAE